MSFSEIESRKRSKETGMGGKELETRFLKERKKPKPVSLGRVAEGGVKVNL